MSKGLSATHIGSNSQLLGATARFKVTNVKGMNVKRPLGSAMALSQPHSQLPVVLRGHSSSQALCATLLVKVNSLGNRSVPRRLRKEC